MQLQPASCCHHPPNMKSLSNGRFLSHHTGSWSLLARCKDQSFQVQNATRYYLTNGLKRTSESPLVRDFNKKVIIHAAKSDPDLENSSGRTVPGLNVTGDRAEAFRGKSGSVSFHGLTHQLIEESKLESAPFKENSGSVVWVLAPVALISSLILPQFFLNSALDSFARDEILSEILVSFSSEVIFYIGLGIFLSITDYVQKPYLQFSPKRWGLITGLKGYLSSAFFIMGLKVIAPLFAVFVTWPILGLPAVVAVAPFLAGCLAQFVFEMRLEKCGSSSWPLVPIIFEVYRLYQLSKAANYMERLMFGMKGSAMTPQVMERSSAMVAMLVTCQVLGLVCLWSLITFLLRLFPSRPVAQKY